MLKIFSKIKIKLNPMHSYWEPQYGNIAQTTWWRKQKPPAPSYIRMLINSWHELVSKCHRCCMSCSLSLLGLLFVLQCSVGHWDWSADDHVCWSHRRCDESVSGTWHQDVRLWSLWCFCQALGHQRRNVPTNLHWPWVGHQCYLCKLHVHCQSVLHLMLHQS